MKFSRGAIRDSEIAQRRHPDGVCENGQKPTQEATPTQDSNTETLDPRDYLIETNIPDTTGKPPVGRRELDSMKKILGIADKGGNPAEKTGSQDTL
jgi:hypothetical protein